MVYVICFLPQVKKKKEWWDGKIEGNWQHHGAAVPTLGWPPPDFLLCEENKALLSSLKKKEVGNGSPKPTYSQDCHKDSLSTGLKIWVPICPFVPRSFSQSGLLSVPESCAARSPRHTFCVISSSRLFDTSIWDDFPIQSARIKVLSSFCLVLELRYKSFLPNCGVSALKSETWYWSYFVFQSTIKVPGT